MNDICALAPMDFHVHTSLSHDGQGTIAEYCAQALKQGMTAVGFCEHLDLDPRDPSAGAHDYERYRAEIAEARAACGDRLLIRMGVEAGYTPRLREEISAWLAEHQYDYALGSVHAIFDGCAGVSEEYDALETFARHEFAETYLEYFETVDELVRSGLFDVIGHLDLIQRYGVNYLTGPLEWGNYYGVLRRILEGAIKRQMALEINTSGLRQAPHSTYPDRFILELYRELGGETVIIGSDAHEPASLGAGVPAAIRLAQEIGLAHNLIFTDRILGTIAE